MKDRAIALALDSPKEQKKNILREYLQSHILYSMQVAGAFQFLIFQGGTALRFLYALKRFSEDLDFSVEGNKKLHIEKITTRILKDLEKGGFRTALHEKKRKAIHVVSFRMSDILFETGISHRKDESLNIHLEIDTHPPKGARTLVTLVNRHFLLSLRHHDLSSALAGKCHAIFTRSYTKGRDLYDLLWYLTQPKPIEPNLMFLNHALEQTAWKGPVLAELNWKKELLNKLKTLQWNDIRNDVAPFLELSEEKDFLTFEHFQSLLAVKR